MKRFFILFAVSAIAISCARIEQSPVATGNSTLTVRPQGVKSYLGMSESSPAIFWGQNEFLSLYYFDGNDNFAQSDESAKDDNDGKLSGSFSFNDLSVEESDNYTLGAVYPASAAASSNNDPMSYKVVLPSIQKSSETTYDPSAFIMVAKAEQFTEFPTEWTASFYRAVSLNCFTLSSVAEDVKAVIISADGKDLAGGRFFDLTDGTANEVYEGKTSITVKYANPLDAGDVNVYFTSWGVSLSEGEEMTIKVIGTENTYTKTITAGSAGIELSESKLSKLTIDFADIDPDPMDLSSFAFARAFAKELETWESTKGSVIPYSGASIEVGNILPSDFSFFFGVQEIDKPQALYAASMIYKEVVVANAPFAETDMPQIPANCNWGDTPYNEGSGNGGEFTAPVVGIDFINNIQKRQMSYFDGHSNTFANVCGSSSHIDSYKSKGAICLERYNLILARVFKYIVDNDITYSVYDAIKDVKFDSGLYEPNNILVAPETISGLSYSGDSGNVTVDAGADWTAVLPQDCDWVTVSPSSGSAGKGQNVTITVSANAGTARAAAIVFKTSARSKMTVSISQDGVPAQATLKDFAQEFVKALDVWDSTIGTVDADGKHNGSTAFKNVHLIPIENPAPGYKNAGNQYDNTLYPTKFTVTVGGQTFTSAQAWEIAQRGMLDLVTAEGSAELVNFTTANGGRNHPMTLANGASLLEAIPSYSSGCKWGNNPWYEYDNLVTYNSTAIESVGVDFMVKVGAWHVVRSFLNITGNSPLGTIGNFQEFGSGSSKLNLDGYVGYISPMREFLILARFYKYLLDNSITENVYTAVKDQKFDFDLY